MYPGTKYQQKIAGLPEKQNPRNPVTVTKFTV